MSRPQLLSCFESSRAAKTASQRSFSFLGTAPYSSDEYVFFKALLAALKALSAYSEGSRGESFSVMKKPCGPPVISWFVIPYFK